MSKIITDNFLNSLPEGNILLLFVNDEEVSFAVADKNNFSYNAFDSIKVSTEESVRSVLENALNTSEILSHANYRNVIFCSGFRKSTIIPSALFDEEKLDVQLQFSYNLKPDDELLTDEIPYLQAVNLFAVQGDVLKLVTTHFNNVEVHHSSTATITYLLANRSGQTGKQIFTVVHDHFYEIIVTEDARLIFYNTFNFANNEEFIYYLLFVCEQLNINPAETPVQFSGKIIDSSEHFTLASKYFSKTTLAERPDSFSYSQEFETLPGTFHYYLFSQLICVS